MAEKVKPERKTGIPALDAIMKATANKFKKDLSGSLVSNYVPMTTGSIKLDNALYIGGLPRGRIIECYGDESSNKTSFCLHQVALAQKRRRDLGIENRMDLWIDMEVSLTADFITGFGIDPDQFIVVRPDNVEQALQVIIDYVKSGAIDTVVLDSVDALQNQKQLARDIGESDVGGVSKEMNDAMRKITKILEDYDSMFLAINQIKMSPTPYGNPRVTPGGRALQYYASVRLEFKKRKPNSHIPLATNMQVNIVKTRCGPDWKHGVLEIPFIYGQGVASEYEVMEVAREYGLLRHSGGQTKIQWDPEGELEPAHPDIEKGKDAGIAFCMENPWVTQLLRELCLYYSRSNARKTREELLEMHKQGMASMTLEETTEDTGEASETSPVEEQTT